MPNWLQLVKSAVSSANPDSHFEIVTGAPTSAEALAALEAQFGFELPEEFRSLYSEADGFGQVHEEAPDRTLWLFSPISQIPDLGDGARSWFQGTHGDFAERFFPFIDLFNGDCLGYVLDETGLPMDGLFCFEHELYSFDEAQDVNEFLTCWAGSIEEFLTEY